MKPISALVAALLPAFAAAQPPVDVRFGDHARFSDFRNNELRNESESAALAEVLRKHLEAKAPARLPPGTRLTVTITDVDMAGEFFPVPRFSSPPVRIVKEAYPPRVDLEFRLARADGRVEREGRRELRDLGFLSRTRFPERETLAHEKALLDDWLKREFAAAR
jgi:hypothetical protein